MRIINISVAEKTEDYVGIKFNETGIDVSFPIGYNKNILTNNDLDNLQDNIKLQVIDLLSIMSETNKYLIENHIDNVFVNENYFPIDAFIWILNDYINNGIYQNRIRTSAMNKDGKIDWKKTLDNKQYQLTEDSIAIIKPFVKSNLIQENIITDIHKKSINIASNQIGWLFGINLHLDDSLNYDNELCLNILKSELMITFNDGKKKLLENLISVFEGLDKNNNYSLNLDFGTNKFHVIWEYILKLYFNNQAINKFYPKGIYHINNKTIYSSSLRPDTIHLSSDKRLYIIDAKYYKYGITFNELDLPQTDSIQKQITYAEYARNVLDYKDIKNLFILPTNNNELHFDNIGYALPNWKININQSEKINIILADITGLISNQYCKNKIVKDLIKLFN